MNDCNAVVYFECLVSVIIGKYVLPKFALTLKKEQDALHTRKGTMGVSQSKRCIRKEKTSLKLQ